MRQRMKNQLVIECSDLDFTTCAEMELYIKQGGVLLCYVPEVIDAETMIVTIPKNDAMLLSTGTVKVQLAYTDADGLPQASEISNCSVKELLKAVGYGN